MKPPYYPLNGEEVARMKREHAGMPQCQKCMTPQRCLIGRLLDSITTLPPR